MLDTPIRSEYLTAKKRDVLKIIKAAADSRSIELSFLRHGAGHDIWRLGTKNIPIPRHTELDGSLTILLFKEREKVFGNDWWR